MDEVHIPAWEVEEEEALHPCYLAQRNLSGHLFSKTEKKNYSYNYYHFVNSPVKRSWIHAYMKQAFCKSTTTTKNSHISNEKRESVRQMARCEEFMFALQSRSYHLTLRSTRVQEKLFFLFT